MKYKWFRNVMTGDEILTISDCSRVIRIPCYSNDKVSYTYYGEYWGDYSSIFPIYTHCKKSIIAVKKQLKNIEVNILGKN